MWFPFPDVILTRFCSDDDSILTSFYRDDDSILTCFYGDGDSILTCFYGDGDSISIEMHFMALFSSVSNSTSSVV